MKKIAFIFPGQGVLYIGMGKDFFEKYVVAREVYQKASEICGIDIAKLCFENDIKMNKTRFTQIAVFTTSLAILRVVEKEELKRT